VTEQLRDRLGRYGIWRTNSQVTPELAAEVERAGYGALWLGGSPGGDLTQVGELLGATSSLMLGTRIVNIWTDGPLEVARSFARLNRHLEAGADQVVIQLLTEPGADPVPGYRDLTRALSRQPRAGPG
jgi:2-methylisocitrate lyase-like PEP mutase family enzyme